MAKEDAKVKAKEAGTTVESAETKSKEEPAKAEETGQDTVGENAEETLDIIEEIEEISGTADENY